MMGLGCLRLELKRGCVLHLGSCRCWGRLRGGGWQTARRDLTRLDHVFELLVGKIFRIDGDACWAPHCRVTVPSAFHKNRLSCLAVVILRRCAFPWRISLLFWRCSLGCWSHGGHRRHRWKAIGSLSQRRFLILLSNHRTLLTFLFPSFFIFRLGCLFPDVGVLSLYPLDLIFDGVQSLTSGQRLDLEWVLIE